MQVVHPASQAYLERSEALLAGKYLTRSLDMAYNRDIHIIIVTLG